MDHSELTDMIQKTAALMEQFERHSRELEQRQQALSRELRQLSEQTPRLIRQSADESMQRIPAAVMKQVDAGLAQALAGYEARLRESGQLLQTGAQAIATQIQRSEKLHKQVLWKVWGGTLGALLLLLAGGIYLSTHYRQLIQENQLTAKLMRAYNVSDVTLCGDQLCANVDVSAKGVGDKNQYRPVRPRR